MRHHTRKGAPPQKNTRLQERLQETMQKAAVRRQVIDVEAIDVTAMKDMKDANAESEGSPS